MDDTPNEPVKPRFKYDKPSPEHLNEFMKRIMSPGEVHAEMVKAMDLAIKCLDGTDPSDENSIVTPTLLVFVLHTNGDKFTHRMDYCALCIPSDHVGTTIQALGMRYRTNDEFVSGLIHFNEAWVSISKTLQPQCRPVDDPNRKEVIQVIGATMTGGLMGMHLPFTRDPATRKPIYNREVIEDQDTLAMVPRVFRLFIKGYAGR